MTQPRSQLISLETTPYYHCSARCVRRAFLCGNDRYSGKNFDHRKPWLVDRLKLLAEVFVIDIAAYAVMSNHYHVVLHVDKSRGQELTDNQVIQRWTRLYSGPNVIHKYRSNEPLSKPEKTVIKRLIECWRKRLHSISWFMRCMNEHLARKANAEDECKGRFWEGRFKSQALLDEIALLSCMTYVDLNPVRAGIARDLKASDFTSIQARIREIEEEKTRNSTSKQTLSTPRLMPFSDSTTHTQSFAALPTNLKDYLALVDWTGRCIRPDKKNHVALTEPKLLSDLKISTAEWRILALEIQKKSINMLNGLNALAAIQNQKVRSKAA